MSYLDAFGAADDFYNAENEPSAIGDWRDDMDNVRMAIADWVDVAVSWQIMNKTGTELAAAEKDVQTAIAKGQKDIDLIIAQSK